tara:strand:+ start:80 stop:265 length:186 start_codon:yes stop_codon:yes gene_type:complete
MVMEGAAKKGAPVLGLVFLVLALVKFLQGDDWVVWMILGIVFGGLGVFSRGKKTDGATDGN